MSRMMAFLPPLERAEAKHTFFIKQFQIHSDLIYGVYGARRLFRLFLDKEFHYREVEVNPIV
jgi:hypothetical protein